MRLIYSFTLLLCLLLNTSCNMSRKVAYLQNAPIGESRTFDERYDLHIKKDDALSIFVFSKEQSLAAPFNMEIVQEQLLNGGSTSNTQNRSQEESRKGFIVDSEGQIDYPIFGKIKVEGMSRAQVADHIKQLLITNGYINDPLVTVRLTNFKVAVLGDVRSPGLVKSETERLTIFEAISQAGDLDISGKRKNVKLVRESEGKREVITLNLQDPELLFSDYYYLQQNDLVYVEPGNSKTFNARVTTFWGFFVSVLSLATSLGLYFAR
ncbi:MAG: polysaccharide biosynthesis/export family protein [Bacteroidales bacterium]